MIKKILAFTGVGVVVFPLSSFAAISTSTINTTVSTIGDTVFDTIVGVLPTLATVLIPIVLLWMLARFVMARVHG